MAEAIVLSDEVKRVPSRRNRVRRGFTSASSREGRRPRMQTRRRPTAQRSANDVALTDSLPFGRVDFDAALEMGAVLDADARGINVADDGAVLLDVDTATRVDVANDFSVGDDFASMNFGSELSRGADGEFVTFEADGAVDDAVNLQVFGAADLPPDLDAGAEARTNAGGRAAEFS